MRTNKFFFFFEWGPVGLISSFSLKDYILTYAYIYIWIKILSREGMVLYGNFKLF